MLDLGRSALTLKIDFTSRPPIERTPRAGIKSEAAAPRILFVYWGRRGLSELVLRLADAVASSPIAHAAFSISRQNDRFQEFMCLGDALEPVETFASSAGAIFCAWPMHAIRDQILARICRTELIPSYCSCRTFGEVCWRPL